MPCPCHCAVQHLEEVIRSKIPGIQNLISSNIDELEKEMQVLGKPIAHDAGVRAFSTCTLDPTPSGPKHGT